MSNPFEPYLPCYPPGTVAERPWWSADRPTVLRLGGTIYRRIDGGEVAVYGGEHPLAALNAYDLAHPLPVPPVLAGQVWAWPDSQRYWPGRSAVLAIVAVKPHDILSDRTGEEGPTVQWGDGEVSDAAAWPPSGAVLVYGPLAPYAPPGWRP